MSDTPALDPSQLAALIDRAIAASRPQPADESPWWKTARAATYVGCSPKALYHAVATGKLRAARVNDRRDLRFRREWLDAFLEASAPVEVRK